MNPKKDVFENTKNILILGSNGMLGSMVLDYLSKNKYFRIFTTYYASNFSSNINYDTSQNFIFDASQNVKEQLLRILNKCKPDYIINCIGIIKPYCRDNDMAGVISAIEVNARFPHCLARIVGDMNFKGRIIQIATDCVYDGKKGKYSESDCHNALDVYGKTKSLGEVINPNFLNIRCSIIGPELNNKLSLLEWFLSNKDGNSVNGFNHHIWNGITTLQFAVLCEEIITKNSFDKLRGINHVLHYIVNESVSKFKLLQIINRVFDRQIQIQEVSSIGEPIDRTLSTEFYPQNIGAMEKAITELKEYIRNSSVFNKRNYLSK